MPMKIHLSITFNLLSKVEVNYYSNFDLSLPRILAKISMNYFKNIQIIIKDQL